MKHKLLRRPLCALLALAMLLGLTVSAVDMPVYRNAGTHLYSQVYQVGANATFTKSTSWHDSLGNETAYSLSYTPGGDVVPMVVNGSTVWGTNRISTITTYLQNLGYIVVGGINADYFSTKTGVPMGMLVRDGRLISSSDGRASIGFNADGSAFLTRSGVQMTLTNHGSDADATNAGQVVQVHHFNKWRRSYYLYMLNGDFDSETHVDSEGTDVVFKVLNGGQVTINGTLELQVADIYDFGGSATIGEGNMILTADKHSPFYEDLAKFKTGDRVTLSVTSDDPRLTSAVYVTGGGSPSTGDGIILENGQISNELGTGTHPRSAVGIKQDGTVIIYAIDGRQSGYSAGLTEWDLADELLQQGCVNAINLDGGGSTALNVRMPGDGSPTTANSPSDGALRSCSTYIMLVNKATPTGVAEHLHFSEENPVILGGSVVAMPAVTAATDNTYSPVAIPSGIAYTADERLGSYDAGSAVLTASAGPVQADFTASAGAALGQNTVSIISAVDSFTVNRADSGAELSSLSLQAGQSLQLAEIAKVGAGVAISSPEAFTYTIAGDVGTITPSGLFTASQTNGLKGSLTVSFGGISKVIPVTIGVDKPVKVEDFEQETSIFDTEVIVHEPRYAKFGTGAALMPASGSGTLYTAGPVYFEHAPAELNLWAKNAAGVSISAQFTDATGQTHLFPFGQTDSNDYVRLTAAVSGISGSCDFTGLLYTAAADFCIDQIYSPGDAAGDTTLPTVLVSVSGNTIAATVSDNTNMDWGAEDVRIYVDGRPVNVSGSGGSFSATAELGGEGLHHVSAQTTDVFGNMGSGSAETTVGSAASSFTDMGGHWADIYARSLSDRGVVNGVASGNGFAFLPEQNITRAEFCTMVGRYLGYTGSEFAGVQAPFLDAASIPSWASGYVSTLYQTGFVSGRTAPGGVIFDPNATITRAEIFTILGKLWSDGFANAPAIPCSDYAEIPAWALVGAKTLVNAGAVGGYTDGTLKPGRSVTRAEVAKILSVLR